MAILRSTILALLFLAVSALHCRAVATHELQNIAKVDEFDQTRIVFDFSELPEFDLETSGQRVDLLLQDTDAASFLGTLPDDDKIVKILLARKSSELLVSILLHQIPARVASIKSPAAKQLTLDIRWKANTAQRPAIAFQLSGMPTPHKTLENIATPQHDSAYAGRWEDFFREFHTPPDLDIPLRHTIPTLPPWPQGKTDKKLKTLIEQANAGQWRALLEPLKKTSDFGESASVAILNAEAALRTGHPDRALEILDHPGTENTPEHVTDRAIYLRAISEAVCGRPYQAQYALSSLLQPQHSSSVFAPYVRFLHAELQLTTGQSAKAYEILREPVQHWPTALQRPVQWRRAEALLLTGKPTKAARSFRRLFSRNDVYARFSDIRYHAAWAFMKTGRYHDAEIHFLKLAATLHNPVNHGNALFLAAQAAYRAGNHKSALVTFEQLRDNFEGSEPGFRAWLALLDHRFIHQGNTTYLQIARDYGTIAGQAPLRVLREEAALKQALAYYLHNQKRHAADLLQVFLRNFSSGPFRKEATALLADILPPLIRKLIEDGQDKEAVIMVEKNRDLLLNGNLSWPFLPALAQAYTRLGLWQKACKTYYFMIDQGGRRQREKPFYLPLTQLLFDRAQYGMAVSFAQRYLDKYPTGEDKERLFELQLAALTKSNRLDEAEKLLQQTRHLQNRDIALQGALIHWKRDNVAAIIKQPAALNDSSEGLLLRAESLFRSERNAEALGLYQQLREQEAYSEQATYRCGQIKLKSGNKREALKLFSQLTENKATSYWGRLAKDALAANRMN
jgi:tetratricopeptide (TPR) repeat protein